MAFGMVHQSVGAYRVEGVLGEGGNATVYRAVHEQLGSVHAIKVVAAPDERMRTRLIREGKAQGAVRHSNLVAVTEVLELAVGPALVLEYVDGPTLSEWLREHEPDEQQALNLFRGIVAGVAAAHREGIAHRDLKPANVLMAQSANQWIPKVTDFGLATVQGPNRTENWNSVTDMNLMPAGTPAYMSPEQVRQEPISFEADLWALGCILFELVCGRRAFSGDDALDLFNDILTARYPDPLELSPTLSTRTVDLIHMMLQLDPSARPRTAVDLLAYLDGGGPRTLSLRPVADRRPRDTQAIEVPTQGVPLWLLLVAMVLMGAGGIAGGLLVAASPEEAEAPATQSRVVIEAPQDAAPAPAPAPVVVEPEPEAAPAAEPVAKPKKRVRRPAPAPAPKVGSVAVSGDATRVQLVGSAGAVAPGSLPVGSYRVVATFGAQQVDAGTVQVTEGGSATIRCSSFTQSCAVE